MSERDESRESSVEARTDALPAAGVAASQCPILDPRPAPSPGQRTWRRFRANRPAILSAWVLGALLLVIALWPVCLKLASWSGPQGAAFAQTHDPDRLSDAQFTPPSTQHWFGTDVHGRDVFSRVVYGAQISLLVGVVGAGVSLIIGVLWGAIAGYVGGRLDSAMMRFVDILYSLPTIIFVIVLLTTLGELLKQSQFVQHSPTLAKQLRVMLLFVGLGAVSWLTMARIVRGQVLSLRSRAFVEASRTLGAGTGVDSVTSHHPERVRRGDRVSHADGARDHSLRKLSELPRSGDSTADGQLGFVDGRGRGPVEPHPHLLVARCISLAPCW